MPIKKKPGFEAEIRPIFPPAIPPQENQAESPQKSPGFKVNEAGGDDVEAHVVDETSGDEGSHAVGSRDVFQSAAN